MTIKYSKNIIPYLLFLLLGFIFFPSSGGDDPYITYWGAYSLSEFGEILNYNGERVEQSSSLLHTIFLAILRELTDINIETISPVLTIFSGLITIFLVGVLSKKLEINVFAVRVLTATSIPLLYWSFSGLETSLISASILLILIAYLNSITNTTKINIFLAMLSISTYILLRPEAFFVVELFLFLSLLAQYYIKTDKSVTFILGIYALIFFIVLLLWRYIYFDAFFPQPVYAKTGMSILAKITDGYHYYQRAINEYLVFIFLFIPIIIFLLNILNIKKEEIIYLYFFTISYLLFIFSSGGDWMGGLRFFAPIVPILFVLAIKQYSSEYNISKIIIIGLAANFYYFGLCVASYSSGIFIGNYPFYKNKLISSEVDAEKYSFFEIANKTHYRDIPTSKNLNTLMVKILDIKTNPTIMSGQAGFVAYHLSKKYYKKFKFIDRYALSSRDLTQCKITKNKQKNAWGLIIRYKYFMKNTERISRICSIDKPDIIFDVDVNRNKVVEKYGYKIVYLQKGRFSYGIVPIGFQGGTKQFIAVKSEIVKKLNLKKIEYIF